MSEPIENYVMLCMLFQMSHQIIVLVKRVFRSVIVLLVVIVNEVESQYELSNV